MMKVCKLKKHSNNLNMEIKGISEEDKFKLKKSIELAKEVIGRTISLKRLTIY